MLQRRFHLHGSTKNKPFYLRHFLSRSQSLFFFTVVPISVSSLSLWSSQNIKICISFLSYFLHLYFLSDLFLFSSQHPLWLQQYIKIFPLYVISCYYSFPFYVTIICGNWQPYIPEVYLAATFVSILKRKGCPHSGRTFGKTSDAPGLLNPFFHCAYLSLPSSLSLCLIICMYVSVWNFWHTCTYTQRSSSSSYTWLDFLPQAELIPLLTDPPEREGRGAQTKRTERHRQKEVEGRGETRGRERSECTIAAMQIEKKERRKKVGI